MDWHKIWTKTWRTMVQALIPFIPINVAMLDTVDPKIIVVEVLGAGLVCFLMGMLDASNADLSEDLDTLPDEPDDDEIIED